MTLPFKFIHHRFLGVKNGSSTVVMVHGVGATSDTWLKVVEPLAMKRRVLLYDQRGHGLTPDTGPGYTYEAMAHDLKGLLDGLGIEKAHLIGHSGGGILAMLFTHMFPDLVHSVVVEDSGLQPLKTATPVQRRQNELFVEHLRSMKELYATQDELIRDLAVFFKGDLERATHYASKMEGEVTSEGISLRMARIIKDYHFHGATENIDDAIKTVRQPVLFLRASPPTKYFNDHSLAYLLEHGHDFRIVHIPDTSHTIHQKQPKAWTEAVTRFLDQVDPV